LVLLVYVTFEQEVSGHLTINYVVFVIVNKMKSISSKRRGKYHVVFVIVNNYVALYCQIFVTIDVPKWTVNFNLSIYHL